MKGKDLKKFLQHKLKKSFENFQIFEEGVDFETQLEFETLSKEFNSKEINDIELDYAEKVLFSPDSKEDELKETLLLLSISDDVKAYRLIEDFKSKCTDKMIKWAALALQKSRAHIEHALSDEDKVYISSGLGGSGDKLRYFFVLTAMEDITFSDFHKEIIQKEIDFTMKKFGGESEGVIFHDFFVTIVCLIPLHVSLDKVFKSILDECNEFGNFMSDKVIATNTEKIDSETIIKILNEDPDAVQPFDQFEDTELFGLDNFDDEDEFDDFDDDDFDDDDYDDDDYDDDDYY